MFVVATMMSFRNHKNAPNQVMQKICLQMKAMFPFNQSILCSFLCLMFMATNMMTGTMSFAQSATELWRLNQRNSNVGARTSGMAARGFAGLGGHSALYSNPAGLGYVDASELIVTLRVLSSDDNSIFGGDINEAVDQFRSDGFTLGRANSREDKLLLGDLAYLYDVPVGRGKLVAALGISRVRDFSSRLEFVGENSETTISSSFLPFDNEYSVDDNGNLDILDDLPFNAFTAGFFEYFVDLYEMEEYPFLEAVKPGTIIEQSGEINGSGGVYELSGGVAWQASPILMVGLSMNVALGSYDYDYQLIETDIFNQNTTNDYNVINDDGSILEGFDQLSYGQTLETGMAGFNMRAGVSADLNRVLRLGLSVETPTWTAIEETYSEQFYTLFDKGGSISVSHSGSGFFEYSTRSPWRFGAGARLQFDQTPIGDLLLTGEAELVDWTLLKLSTREDGNVFGDVNTAIENDFDLALNYALGAELEINRAIVRFGIGVRPSPYKKRAIVDLGLNNDYSLDQYSLSFGFGYQMSSEIRAELGVQLTNSIPELWEVYPSDSGGPRQGTLFEIDQIQNQSIFVLGLSMNI